MFDGKISDNVLTAINLLEKSGFEAFVVGGAVRDILMGREPHDFDITTSATVEEMKAAFASFKFIETGIKHGTLTVLINGEAIETTTYRVDGEYDDSRHPKCVSFTRNLKEDLKRRDFTVNALAYSPTRGLVDEFGGADDIKRGIIRAVGDPVERFKEDALRILRAIRFSSTLGFEIEAKTRSAVLLLKDSLLKISAERIREETDKLLLGEKATEVIREYTAVIGVYIPELLAEVGFEQHNFHHKFDVFEHSLAAFSLVEKDRDLKYTALLHDIGKPQCFFLDAGGVGHFYGHERVGAEMADAVLRRLKLDNTAIKRITSLIRYHGGVIEKNEKSVRRFLAKHGRAFFDDMIKLKIADNTAKSDNFTADLNEYSEIVSIADKIETEKQCFSLKQLAVKGEDVMALGLHGKEVGEALNCALSEVIDGNIENERESVLAFIKSMYPL